ncbi:MAG: hypothetical protein AAF221_13720 [Pseudomonadota bacterium]
MVTALPARAQAGAATLAAKALYRDSISDSIGAATGVRALPPVLSARLFLVRPQAAQANAAAPVMKGCASAALDDRTTLFAGGWSRCIGGRLSQAERRIQAIDYDYAQMDGAAYAMQADPRAVMQAPLSATAGIALPVNAAMHIGIEYSYTEPAGAAPYHFRSTGGPADELVGHSATVRLGLQL